MSVRKSAPQLRLGGSAPLEDEGWSVLGFILKKSRFHQVLSDGSGLGPVTGKRSSPGQSQNKRAWEQPSKPRFAGFLLSHHCLLFGCFRKPLTRCLTPTKTRPIDSRANGMGSTKTPIFSIPNDLAPVNMAQKASIDRPFESCYTRQNVLDLHSCGRLQHFSLNRR